MKSLLALSIFFAYAFSFAQVVIVHPAPVLVRRTVYISSPRPVPIASVKKFVDGLCSGKKITVMSDGALVKTNCNGNWQEVVGRLATTEVQTIMRLGSQVENTNRLVAIASANNSCGFSQNEVINYFALDAYNRMVAVGGQRGCDTLVMEVDKRASEDLSNILARIRIRHIRD